MGSEYQVWLNTPEGHHIASLDEFYSLHAARAVNQIGVLELTIPDAFPYGWLRRDLQIEVIRKPERGAAQLLTDTVWLLRSWGQARNEGAIQYTLSAVSLTELLSRRIVYAAPGSAEADKSDAADDMLKAIVRESMGALVGDSARSLTKWLSVAADTGQAPNVAKKFGYRNVLACAQEICDTSTALGTPLYFDIIAASASAWVFQTYIGQRGVDRTASGMSTLAIGEESGVLANPSLAEDYSDEVTYCYAGGHGVGTARIIGTAPRSDSSEVSRLGASPFNRRESFIDVRNGYATLESAQYEAEAELRRLRPRRTFTGRIIDTDGASFGVHWGWGDRLTVTFNGALADCVVSAIDISVSRDTETLGATLRSAE
jgi:hypothetical protein